MTKNSGKLKVTTPSDREIVMTRSFDAPCHLVWKAMTTPELIRRWIYFPPDWKMTVCEEDTKVGGGFRWEWAGPGGQTMMVMHGVYREVVPPGANGQRGRIVRTETMEFGSICGESLVTLELTEREGERKTNLTLTILFKSKSDRDGALASGMERGVATGYDRLEEILVSEAIGTTR
jgi:uncharacterized protein YndB with AHSA1/START domain